eukprot:944603-Pyramimonas_sp.AAC.1
MLRANISPENALDGLAEIPGAGMRPNVGLGHSPGSLASRLARVWEHESVEMTSGWPFSSELLRAA